MKKFYSRFFSKKILIVLLCLICGGRLWATDVSGDTSTLWTKANSPYVLVGSVTVPQGKTLTIEPGVIVQLPAPYIDGGGNGGYVIDVEGDLIAEGSITDSIIFKGDGNTIDNGSYHRHQSGPIKIETKSNSILRYVVIDELGFGSSLLGEGSTDNNAALNINSSTAIITNSTIKNTRGIGLLYQVAANKIISSNSFVNNSSAGLKFRNTCILVDSNYFSNYPFDIITGLDNLGKIKNNTFINARFGLTSEIAMTKNDTLAAVTSKYYELCAAIPVPSGRILTIEPGVTVQFPARYIDGGGNGAYSLNIDGNLIAKGTNTNLITFRGDGFTIDNGSYHRWQSGPVYIGSISNSILQNVVVDQLGFGSSLLGDIATDNSAAINISSSSVSVLNCTVQNVRGIGILYNYYNGKPLFNNYFTNDRVGIKFRNLTAVIDTNHFSLNDPFDIITPLDNLGKILYPANEFMNAGIGLTSDISMGRNDTMAAITYRYVLLDTIRVPFGKTLTVLPSVRVEFPARYIDGGGNGAYSLNVDGNLLAKGTNTSFITFKGDGFTIDNGSYHRWQSGPVTIGSTSNSVLQYIIADELGGGTSIRNDITAAFRINSTSTNVLNCTIQNTRGTGIVMQNSSPYIAGSCFNSNVIGIFSSGGKAKIFHNNFVGNSSFGIKNISLTDTLDATNCWWNYPDGPANPTTNPVGGDVVSDYVLYAPWAIEPFECSDSLILPLTLLNFQTTLSNNIVNCTWQTANEVNTSYFLIQRSKDGVSFTGLGKIYATGNSTVNKTYSFTDKSPNNGINYYRLQMIDKDGKYSYSKTVPINITIKQPFAIYPNPVKDVLYVQVQRNTAEKVSLQIIDMQGKTIMQQSRQLETGVTTLTMNTSALAKGSYFAVIKGQTTEKKLFIKE